MEWLQSQKTNVKALGKQKEEMKIIQSNKKHLTQYKQQ